jgi:hypothetical protein
VPLFAALDGGQSHVAVEPASPIGWIRPRDRRSQVAHDFPVREEDLRLGSVGEIERAQDETRGFKQGRHGIMRQQGRDEKPQVSRASFCGAYRATAGGLNYSRRCSWRVAPPRRRVTAASLAPSGRAGSQL